MGTSSDEVRQEIDRERADAGQKVDQLWQRVQGLGSGAPGGSLRGAVTRIVEDLRNVVRGEVELAKTEMKADAAQIGKGAGMIAGSGVLGFTAFVFLMLSVTFLLSRWVKLWLSAGIVALALAVVAVITGVVGKNEVQRARLKSEQTIQSVKEDVEAIKEEVQSVREP